MKVNLSTYDSSDDTRESVPPGEYSFEVEDAVSDFSANGNDMMKLTLSVEVERDEPITVFDYLVAVDNAKWKIYGFCQSVGLGGSSDELLPEQCLSRSGRANFGLGKPTSEGYRYLVIKKYLPRDTDLAGTSDKAVTKKHETVAIEQQNGQTLESVQEELPF